MGVVIATPLERGLLATGTWAMCPEDRINRSFSPDVLQHVGRIDELCAEFGVRLLSAALQYVLRNPLVSTTVPGFRSPEQPAASVEAVLKPIPDAFWQAVEPLVRDFKTAGPPGTTGQSSR